MQAPMFIGTYEHNIDDKGRLAIPAKFREGLQDGSFTTRGLDKCLFIFPKHEWERQLIEFSKLPLTMGDARSYSRLFFSGASECELDKQGRINIPLYLREYADLSKSAVVIGVMSRIEIWSQEIWTAYKDTAEESYEEIAEKLANGMVPKV